VDAWPDLAAASFNPWYQSCHVRGCTFLVMMKLDLAVSLFCGRRVEETYPIKNVPPSAKARPMYLSSMVYNTI